MEGDLWKSQERSLQRAQASWQRQGRRSMKQVRDVAQPERGGNKSTKAQESQDSARMSTQVSIPPLCRRGPRRPGQAARTAREGANRRVRAARSSPSKVTVGREGKANEPPRRHDSEAKHARKASNATEGSRERKSVATPQGAVDALFARRIRALKDD